MHQYVFQCLLRWCLVRLKRTLVLVPLLVILILVVLLAFVTLNQDHVQLNVIKAHLRGGNGLGPELYDIWSITHKKKILGPESKLNVIRQPKQRPMVQFFPDNQNRLLYRKAENTDDAFRQYEEETKAFDNPAEDMKPKSKIAGHVPFISRLRIVSKGTLHNQKTKKPQRTRKMKRLKQASVAAAV